MSDIEDALGAVADAEGERKRQEAYNRIDEGVLARREAEDRLAELRPEEDKPWEDPQDTSQVAVLGRLVETLTEQLERQRGEVSRLRERLDKIVEFAETHDVPDVSSGYRRNIMGDGTEGEDDGRKNCKVLCKGCREETKSIRGRYLA